MKTSNLRQSPKLALALGTALILCGFGIAKSASAQDTCGTASLSPVAYGQVVRAFGDEDAQSLKSRGVTIQTQAKAGISSPARGAVEYAGPIDNMGQVVVLNIGRNYRVVMAGLSQVSVKAGDMVSTYSDIGTMPNAARTAKLYMEVRCGEEPVDPQQTSLIAMR